MDPNNNPFNTQNSNNFPFNYPNSNIPPNQSSSQPQNIPNYGFTPNFFMPSSVPNYPPPYYGMMPYPYHTTQHSSIPTNTEYVPNVGTTEFPEFSTQMALGAMSGGNQAPPDAEDSAPTRRKNFKWTTGENLVLLSGWIKFGTDSILGRNQKSEAYWGKIAEYCNEHCSFDPPRDGAACRNHYNYINKKLGKWVGAYDKARRMQQSGWSENDILAKTHELYSSDKNEHFNLMSEWLHIRDQPRYGSQVGGNIGSGSSGSKRSRESDASDSNSVGSSVRPTGRDAAKKKGKKKGKSAAMEAVNEDWRAFEQLKKQELDQLAEITRMQKEAIQRQDAATAETNRLMEEKNRNKKMKMWLKLSDKEDLDEKKKEILQKLTEELFGK